jgi:cell division septum initiation protein DivIVA
MDILKLLDEVESLVEDAPRFLGYVQLDREEFFDLVSKTRAALPDEVRKASKVAADSDKIVGSAKELAEQKVMDAQQQAQQIQQMAQANSEKIVTDSKSQAERRLRDAQESAEKLLIDAKETAMMVVEEAQSKAEHIISDAQQHADFLVSEHEITRNAGASARDAILTAEHESKELRRGSEQYAHDELMRMERVLSDGLLAVQKGRLKLEQRLGAHAPEHAEPDLKAPPVRNGSGRHSEPAGTRR